MNPSRTSLPRSLPEDEVVDVWILDLTAPWCDALADRNITSGADRARADRMATDTLRRRLLVRRSAMRCVLAHYLGRGAEAVEIVTAPGGKPVLVPVDGATFPFSVGHSGDLYGVAVGTSKSIGFDIERRRRVPRAEGIASRWFDAAEGRALDGLEGEDLEREFMRIWTAKEALAKRHGAGLRLMMRGDTEVLDTEAAASGGRLRWLSPRDEYHVAVASTDPIRTVRLVIPETDEWTR
ncbi:MAG: 4'-phosphopantetheinyl transferase superfamily protein [Gemmatimonadetes bacterium]|nr:4'-phosphopantetheinyl transferase superfamily protein [Gemmatimonadota bacterium]